MTTEHIYKIRTSMFYDRMRYKMAILANQLSPKEYGQKLLNRKRGRK